MGFKKTTAEIARLQEIMAQPQAQNGRMLSIQFETDPAFIKQVLPPGLEPTDQAMGTVFIGDFKGSNAGPYKGATVFVSASAGDIKGDYCLAFYVSSDQASLFGRQMMGEPKKVANINFEIDGDNVHAGVSRLGKEIISIDASLGDDIGPLEFTSSAFYYKHRPNIKGQGLEEDPLLLEQINSSKLTAVRPGKGSLNLSSSPHDPLADIPVHDITLLSYYEGDLFADMRMIQSVDRQAYLPFAFAAYDNWDTLFTG